MGWTGAPRPRSAPRAAAVALPRPLGPADVALLCGQVTELLRSGATVVACDVGGHDYPDLLVIDALVRLALTARRAGGCLRVRGGGDELRRLLDLTGLAGVVQPEEGEPG
ncbi:MAG: STAS domain-containing protein [Frankiaceae bacterium]